MKTEYEVLAELVAANAKRARSFVGLAVINRNLDAAWAAARARVKAGPGSAALTLLRTLEFDAKGYCHVCGGWEQIKGQGCTTRRHMPDCAWVAATKESAS